MADLKVCPTTVTGPLISNTADGPNQTTVGIAERLTQTDNRVVDSARGRKLVLAPHAIEDLRALHHPRRRLAQQLQHTAVTRLQEHRRATILLHGHRVEIDRHRR